MEEGVDAGAEKSAPKETPAKAKPIAKQAVPTAAEVAVNTPLKFRLDKLDTNHPYLLERGLSPETIACFGIGFCSKGMMADRIAIPIQNCLGEVVAGEPTGDIPKYKLPQGFRKSLELFNIHRAILEPVELPLVIVEGFFDCIMLYQNGYHKVVALMGSSMSVAQEKLIQANSNQRSLIVVMLDEDEAGRTGREDIANRLAQFAFVKIHAFPEEGQQPEHLNAEDVKTLLN
jgi:DNA primase